MTKRTRIHIVAPLGKGTGNFTTAVRLKLVLESRLQEMGRMQVLGSNGSLEPFLGRSEDAPPVQGPSSELVAAPEIILHDTNEGFPTWFARVMSEGAHGRRGDSVPGPGFQAADSIITLHALRSAPWMRHAAELGMRHRVLIFGGTDVNEFSKPGGGHSCCSPANDPTQGGTSDVARAPLERMTEAVTVATALVCFSPAVLSAARQIWSSRENMIIVPQSVFLPPGETVESLSQPDRSEESLRQLLQTTSHPTTDDNELYCLLPCSIRAVKDPMFALRAFAAQDLATMGPHLVLLVLGPVHEPGLANEVEHLVSQNSHRCRWSKGVSSATLLSAMAHPRVKCVLNCSRSEGEPQAVLEAMAMGCPVAVRDIPGNTAVVTDRVNGFVFRTPEELMDILVLLAGHGNGRPSSEPVHGALPPEAHLESMVCAAKEYIRTEHNPQKEADAYLKALGLL